MSYTVDFSRDKRGKFRDINSFISVVYGTDALYVEDTLNEMQWVQYSRFSEFMRHLAGSGVFVRNIDNVDGMYTHDNYTLKDYTVSTGGSPVLSIANMGINIGGHITYIKDINLTEGSRTKGLNKIVLPAGPSSGERYDIVYVETWLEEVKQGSTLYECGCEGGEVLANPIGDRSRFPSESEIDRRVQIRSRLRVKTGVTFTDNQYGLVGVKAKGGATSDTTLVYNYLDSGKVSNIFRAGNGNSASSTSLRSIDGYSYAMTLFKIKRTNRDINIDTDIDDLRIQISNSGDLFELINNHIGSRGTNNHGLADSTTAGFLSPTLYKKILGIEDGATGNMTAEEITSMLNDCLSLLYSDRLKDSKGNLLKVEDFERAFSKKTGFNKDFGAVAGTVAQGNDTRFLTTVQKNNLVSSQDCTLHFHRDDRKWSNLTGIPNRFSSSVFVVNNLSLGANAIFDIEGATGGNSLGLLPKANKFSNLGSSTLFWNGIYGTVLYEDGSRLDTKYAKLNNVSQDIIARDITVKRDIKVEGRLSIGVGDVFNYTLNSKNYSLLAINSTGNSITVGNTTSDFKINSRSNPTVGIGSNTYTLLHTGNDSGYVKYSKVVDNLKFDIATTNIGDITKGISWSGATDTFKMFVEKYVGTEGHRLVLECGDNTIEDRFEIRHKSTNGTYTLSTFSSDGVTSNVNHIFAKDVYAHNHVDGKDYKIVDNQARLWRAVYQDLAELWKKDPNCDLEAGDVMIMGKNGLLTTNVDCDGAVVGVYSDTFGMCLGGEGESIEDIIASGEMVPIGIAGKVLVKVIGDVHIGDLLVTSEVRGKARALGRYEMRDLGIVFGKALEEYNEAIDGSKRIWMMIMNA